MLTDNEKAATFIGWTPEATCQSSECEWRGPAWLDDYSPCPHPIPAPDMSRPDNYMQALEGLVARGITIESCLYKGSPTPYGRYSIWLNGPIDKDDGPSAEIRAPLSGHPAVQVLAALYDKEHPNDAN